MRVSVSVGWTLAIALASALVSLTPWTADVRGEGPAALALSPPENQEAAGAEEAAKKHDGGGADPSDAQADPQDAAKKKPAKKKPKKEAAADATGDGDAAKPVESAADADTPALAKDAAPAAEQPKADTHKVQRERLRIEVELDGIFEAQKTVEVAINPRTWSSFKVISAVEHGKPVKRGDVLAVLDLEPINQAIADLQTELKLTELGIQQADRQLAALEQLTPLELAATERSYEAAKEDYEFYLETIRPLQKKNAEFNLRSARQNLEYLQEELDQLEKMYGADELTEETEAIVLRRARNAVERAKFVLEIAEVNYDRTIQFELPRQEADLKDDRTRTDVRWETAKLTLAVALERQRLEREKLLTSHKRSQKRLDDLLADREAMTVRAPADGVVYYGQCDRGSWSSAAMVAKKLRRGGTLSPDEVFMTVVQMQPLFVRCGLPEKHLATVRTGIKGDARPTGFADVKLEAIVQEVSRVPLETGNYEAKITVTLGSDAEPLAPGMSCKVKLTTYDNPTALTVPPKAVATDKDDPDKSFVVVVDAAGKQSKQFVEVGKRTDSAVEILSGLAEGDTILKEVPKDWK